MKTNLISYGAYLQRNRPYFGQQVVIEKERQLLNAEIISFAEYFTTYNELTMSRLCENWAIVKTETGELLKNIPFSMIYLPASS